jgi:hypothetical protein
MRPGENKIWSLVILQVLILIIIDLCRILATAMVKPLVCSASFFAMGQKITEFFLNSQ